MDCFFIFVEMNTKTFSQGMVCCICAVLFVLPFAVKCLKKFFTDRISMGGHALTSVVSSVRPFVSSLSLELTDH